jgi:hypothetical protein
MSENELSKMKPSLAKVVEPFREDFDPDFEEYDLEEGKDFIAHVKPLRACTVDLCGFVLNFQKLRNPKTGKWAYKREHLDSRKFIGKKEVFETDDLGKQIRKLKSTGKTVLPEMLQKLTHHLNKIVDVQHIEYVSTPKKTSTKK